MELALGLSEVFRALKEIASGNPNVRLQETSPLELIAKLKGIVNLTAEDMGEMVDLSHEFAMGLAEHFDVLHRVSKGDLNARVNGDSGLELLGSLKNVTNEMIESVSREITERKSAQNALEKSEQSLSQIVQGSPVPTFVIDGDHTVTHWNRACENLTGISAGEVVGTTKQWSPFYKTEKPVMADLVLDDLSAEEVGCHYGKKCQES
ncbi:MAG: PAS domain-containing protein, partial [Deltaproteobacteria bacterium]|nr:PAS domain-containing protein [Deltaproteobacteria bacterium]